MAVCSIAPNISCFSLMVNLLLTQSYLWFSLMHIVCKSTSYKKMDEHVSRLVFRSVDQGFR